MTWVWYSRESGPWSFHIQTHWQSRPTGKNSDPLVKSRPTVTRNIQKWKSCLHQYFIYIHKFNKTMAWKENHMVDKCMRTDSSCCDPSHITLDLRSQVIWLGSQLEESFLTHLSTIRFSLNEHLWNVQFYNTITTCRSYTYNIYPEMVQHHAHFYFSTMLDYYHNEVEWHATALHCKSNITSRAD